MTDTVKHWYLPLFGGLVLLFLGIYSFVAPGQSYLALTFVFSMSFIISGLSEVIFAISNKNILDNWGWVLILGLMTAFMGGILIGHPGISAISLPIYVGMLLMFRAFGTMGIAIELKNYKVIEWGTVMVLGVLLLLFSFGILFNPLFGGLTIVFWTGLAFIAGGIINIIISLKFRKMHKNGLSQEALDLIEKTQNIIETELSNYTAD